MDAQDKQDGMGWMTRDSRVPSSTQTVIASAARQSRQGNDAAATTRSPRRCAPRDDKLGTREVGQLLDQLGQTSAVYSTRPALPWGSAQRARLAWDTSIPMIVAVVMMF